MRKAILTAGPQGAGKTSFCKEIIQHRPEVVIVELDAIWEELVEIHGKSSSVFDPYCGGHLIGERLMWQRVEEKLAGSNPMTIILDAYRGFPEDRSSTAKKLRSLGVDCVELWYFVTPEAVCLQQYETREGSKWTTELQKETFLSSRQRDFRLWHSRPIEDHSDESSFDNIKMINPLQLTFIPYADILL